MRQVRETRVTWAVDAVAHGTRTLFATVARAAASEADRWRCAILCIVAVGRARGTDEQRRESEHGEMTGRVEHVRNVENFVDQSL